MPKANRKCFNCGASYYACSACIGIRSWKNVCCSVECYREMFKKEIYNPDPIEQDTGEIENMYVVLKKIIINMKKKQKDQIVNSI